MPPHDAHWPYGDGEMVGRVRDYDWAATSLGSAEAWPSALKSAVSLILGAAAPMGIYWGSGHVIIYNDAWRNLLRHKHPGALGRSAREVFPEIWDRIGPLFAAVMAGRSAAEVHDQLLPLDRAGRIETAWFNFSNSPIWLEDGSIGGILNIAAETTRRLPSDRCRDQAERALHESEELRRIALESGGMGTWRWDTRSGLVRADDAFQSLWGVSFADTLHPASVYIDLMDPVGAASLAAVMAKKIAPGEVFQDQVQVVGGPNAGRWVQWRGRAERDRPWIINGVTFDITERANAEAALRESEQRFREFSEASSSLVWMRDAETLRLEYVSPAYEQIYSVSRTAALANSRIDTWLSLIHPDDQGEVLAGVERARGGSSATYQFRVAGPSDTGPRWMESTAFPLRDRAGHVRRIGGIAKDITEQKVNAARLEVMVAELQHRTRNLLGVVRSIARQTLARTGPNEAFTRQFNDRLSALSRVQGLLSRSDLEPINIRALVRTELDALGAAAMQERVVVEGPPVRLPKTTVQTLALALHELATNAHKYGALSDKPGRLSVTWRVSKADADQRRLVLDWIEEGILGPRGADPARARRGYGRELIERALPYALKALTSYDLGETELRCRIDLPLSKAA